MGAVQRLGRRGIALGAGIAIVFGVGAGLLAMRWSEAEAGASAALRPAAAALAHARTVDVAPRPVSATKAARARPVSREACGGPRGRLIRYRVQVDPGLETSRVAFARAVSRILCDPRGWTASRRVRFRYDPEASVVIRLASPGATERRCLALIGLSVHRTWSCASRSAGEVVLNAARWFGGSPSWPGSVRRYRWMLVSHEVGHVLGHGHRGCPAAGARAPVMMQQSKGIFGCRPNPWPTSWELAATR